MRKKFNYLGLLSLLSLVSLLGRITENTGLYGFLGFIYFIRYFWIIPDEFSGKMFRSLQRLLLWQK